MSASIIKAKPLAVLIAVVAWFAVSLQWYVWLGLAHAMGMSTLQGLAMYLGYFTILTNLLVGVTMVLPLLSPASAGGGFFARPMVLGGVTASIAFVGLAYFVLLRHVWHPQGLRLLGDVLLHYVVPTLVVIHSMIVLRGRVMRWTAPLWWSLYLVAYFVYVLVRGAYLGRYPYPFIDLSRLGYALTLRNAVMLWLAFLGLSYVLMALWQVRITHKNS